MNLTWKEVFNADLNWWGRSYFARNWGSGAGYKFFSWNGRIYNTSEGKDTGLKVEDIK